MHDPTPIELRLDRLEAKRSVDLDAVALAASRLRDPERVREHLGPGLLYSQRVEAEVAGMGIQVLLPHAKSGLVGRFLDTWVPDEQRHGVAQEILLEHLGLQSYVPRAQDTVPIHNRAAGWLTRMLPAARGIVEMAYHAIGAINERLAMEAYRQMADRLDVLGETELVDTLMAPMRNDEAMHLAYYRTYARQLRTSLSNWQLAVVRGLIVHTYAPVGAGADADKAPLGRAILSMGDDPENPVIAKHMQAIAEELLNDGAELKPFVRHSLVECVRLARAA
jgi:uncharacterized protein YidB (DUF937 family)